MRSAVVADIFRSAEYARLRVNPKVRECLKGQCCCANAAQCKYARCSNCDWPVDRESRKTLVDHSCDEYDTCPVCDGPLNERRIYGSLVD